ncbi:MAG TPA: TMEM165/GDT1 family protein, partial [Stellaceae bacterium]
EIGDKTQLLALLLASRFRRPVPIILGMLAATTLNHGLAGLAGGMVAAAIDPVLLRWGLGLTFLAMAAWALIPDTLDQSRIARHAAGGAFIATAASFFLAEMGDKTQVATAALAAHFGAMGPVILGTTIGMMAVDVPTVLCGHIIGDRISPRGIRYVAAGLFAIFGTLALLGIEPGLRG